MNKLLIVEDEPLVQIGVKSMLSSRKDDIDVIGIASNGKSAIEKINKQFPDIIITDIKMPIMDGIELIKYCTENYENPPIFIILTSYEEFSIAQKAIKYNVSDYLIKIELTEEVLNNAVDNAIKNIRKVNSEEEKGKIEGNNIGYFQDSYLIKLLYNLFENDEQVYKQAEVLNLELSEKVFITCFGEIKNNFISEVNDSDKFICSYNMLKSISPKHLNCFIVSLDINHFAIICYYDYNKTFNFREYVKNSLKKILVMVENYFNVRIKLGVSNSYNKLELIATSFQESRQALNEINPQESISLYSNNLERKFKKSDFTILNFKEEIRKSIEEYNTDELYKILTNIIEKLKQNNDGYIQALDYGCSLLYLFLNLLPDGETCMNEMFSYEKDGYKSIYNKKNVVEIINWIYMLRNELCKYIEIRKKSYKHHIVTNVKKYINNNLTEKLYLNEIAELHNISPSYLSSIFKKECGIGFSEYINQMKINKAKELLISENCKIYEISEKLGFDSAFYFSKVFKKVTGASPKEYSQKNC